MQSQQQPTSRLRVSSKVAPLDGMPGFSLYDNPMAGEAASGGREEGAGEARVAAPGEPSFFRSRIPDPRTPASDAVAAVASDNVEAFSDRSPALQQRHPRNSNCRPSPRQPQPQGRPTPSPFELQLADLDGSEEGEEGAIRGHRSAHPTVSAAGPVAEGVDEEASTAALRCQALAPEGIDAEASTSALRCQADAYEGISPPRTLQEWCRERWKRRSSSMYWQSGRSDRSGGSGRSGGAALAEGTLEELTEELDPDGTGAQGRDSGAWLSLQPSPQPQQGSPRQGASLLTATEFGPTSSAVAGAGAAGAEGADRRRSQVSLGQKLAELTRQLEEDLRRAEASAEPGAYGVSPKERLSSDLQDQQPGGRPLLPWPAPPSGAAPPPNASGGGGRGGGRSGRHADPLDDAVPELSGVSFYSSGIGRVEMAPPSAPPQRPPPRRVRLPESPPSRELSDHSSVKAFISNKPRLGEQAALDGDNSNDGGEDGMGDLLRIESGGSPGVSLRGGSDAAVQLMVGKLKAAAAVGRPGMLGSKLSGDAESVSGSGDLGGGGFQTKRGSSGFESK